MANLLSIGAFSMATSLSIPALRHYDEVDVLKPAVVDPVTGYRRYRPEQVRDARLICSLRAVDLPIDRIRDVLEAQDSAFTHRVLEEHRERLEERARQVTRMATALDAYIEKGVPMPTVDGCRVVQVKIAVSDFDESVRFYQEAFGASFDEGYGHFQFGTYRTDGFFLLTLGSEHGKPGTGDFGLLVDDLDVVHARALSVGAREAYQAEERVGMPRSSGVYDPSGNLIHLYQG